jgi:hypothetical protein
MLAKVIDITVGLRVTEAGEFDGLDRDQHGETAYSHDIPVEAMNSSNHPRPAKEPQPVG